MTNHGFQSNDIMERAEEEVNISRGGAWLSEKFISCT